MADRNVLAPPTRHCTISPAVGTAAATVEGACRHPRSTTRMGTDFEDEAAREKLRAMLNRQFGIGDVSDSNRTRAEMKAVLRS